MTTLEFAPSPVELWTDGSTWPNPGPGGWAYRIILPCSQGTSSFEVLAENCGELLHTSTARAEQIAAIEGIRMAHQLGIKHIRVMSDSAYMVNCFIERWYSKWFRNGWMTSARKPVENQDLWKILIDLNRDPRCKIEWEHCKGHSGLIHNEAVDVLAGECRLQATQLRREQAC